MYSLRCWIDDEDVSNLSRSNLKISYCARTMPITTPAPLCIDCFLFLQEIVPIIRPTNRTHRVL